MLLQDIVEELWTGQGALVRRGEKPKDASDLLFRDYTFDNKEFGEAVYNNTRDDMDYPVFSRIHDAKMRFLVGSFNPQTRELERYEVELDIKATNYIKSLSGKGVQNIHMILGAEMVVEDDTHYRMKMFPLVSTERGNMRRVSAEQHPEIVEDLSEQFQMFYRILQDMGYLARN